MELKVKPRAITGKKVKNLRKEGLVPAEIFGHGVENKHISIDEKHFKDVYKTAGSHTIVQVLTEEGVRIPALISEVQNHPLTRRPLSVLIRGIRADEAIETKIPIDFKGSAPAEKSGFVVVKVLDEIEIEALPDKIPHSFEVDLSKLTDAGDSIHVSNLEIPEGVKVLQAGDTVIATVTEREKEEAPPPEPKEAETPAAEEAKAAEEKTKEETPEPEKEEKKQ
jgi:large subunit ribosomal protein L25